MKIAVRSFMAIAALAALSAAVRASDNAAVVVRPAANESIEITAQRLPENTPVAISGTVVATRGRALVIERPDGVVRATFTDAVDPWTLYTGYFPPDIGIGRAVTVFGRVDHTGAGVRISGDAVLDRTSGKLITFDSFPGRAEGSVRSARKALEDHVVL